MSANQDAEHYPIEGAQAAQPQPPPPPPNIKQPPPGHTLGIKGICAGIGFALVASSFYVVGIVNLLGLYMWPGKHDCRKTLRITQREIDDVIDEVNLEMESSFSIQIGQNRSSDSIDLTPSKYTEEECNNLHNRKDFNLFSLSCATTLCWIQLQKPRLSDIVVYLLIILVYYASNILFMFSSIAAGLCMALAAFGQSKFVACGSVVCLVCSMLFIFMQAIPVYQYSRARYWVSALQQAEMAGLKMMDQSRFVAIERPAVSVDVHRTLSCLLSLVFLGIYGGCIGFATCLYQTISSENRNYIAAGPYPPTPASAQVQQQQHSTPSNYKLQQQHSQPQHQHGGQVVPAQVSPPPAQPNQ